MVLFQTQILKWYKNKKPTKVGFVAGFLSPARILVTARTQFKVFCSDRLDFLTTQLSSHRVVVAV